MTQTTGAQTVARRIALLLIGGTAALALWALVESWDGPALPPIADLAMFSFITVYAGVALALAGPVSIGRSLSGALIPATVSTVLLCLAGLRFETPTEAVSDPALLAAWFLFAFVFTPFLSVRLQSKYPWFDYAALFDTAWGLTVRYFAAWVFVGVFWLTLFLSSALLELVDVTFIETIIETEWMRFALSGAVLGLALAVVYERRSLVSSLLFRRLLRLLVPVVLAVVLVFLAAVPLRGLSHLFGEFSAAGSLMTTCAVAILLITTALDRDQEHMVSSGGLRLATRLLAGVLPILAVLAFWSVAIRVQAYGWTPDRVLAMCSSLILLAYGLGYAGMAAWGAKWPERIRRFNVVMALFGLVVCALWQTPVLDAYRISATSQVARFEAGQSKAEQFPLRRMAEDWGNSGQAGLRRLLDLAEAGGDSDLAGRVQASLNRTLPPRSVVEISDMPTTTELLSVLPVRPVGQRLTISDLDGFAGHEIRQWWNGCQRTLADGRPGCVLVKADFNPWWASGQQGLVLYVGPDDLVRGSFLRFAFAGPVDSKPVRDVERQSYGPFPKSVLVSVLEGGFEIAPSGVQSLHLPGFVLSPAE